jgi:adenosylhomocysteinase
MIHQHCDASGGSPQHGEQKVRAAELEMPGLSNLCNRYGKQKPLSSVSVLGCVTVTPQTGVYILTLGRLGAQVSWCSDNQFATDADVVAYLKSRRVPVFAEPHMTTERYFACMEEAIANLSPAEHVHVHDDGCDIFRYIVESRRDFLSQITGLLEQTTCGSNALRRLLAQHDLKVRAVDINNAFLKRFDNRFGTQESLLCSLTNTGITIGGKRVAVVGYGVVGEGAAKALRSLGASVAVVEADILKLAQARWEGFIPLTLEEALATSDLVLTATGCAPTITGEMIDANAHSGLILANVGHGREEYDVGWLERHPAELFNCYRRAYRLQDGRRIHSLCEGALVNFIAGPANPSGVMSLTFTLCSLVHIEMAASEPHKVTGLMAVDESLERLCAELNFPELQAKVYKLSRQQRQYLALE